MPVFASIIAFNAGELSPKMLSRSDVSQYSKGCRKLENFIVTPYGSVEKRPGLEFVSETKYPDKNCRLIPFVFSRDIAYVCEFGDRYIRFFRDGSIVAGAEVTAPYTEQQLDDIKFIQSADVMTVVHPEHPVMELKRMAEKVFVLEEKQFEYPPVLEQNIDDAFTITPSAREGNITLTASKDCFESGNAGGFFQLVHSRKENDIEKDFTADGVTDSLEVRGFWSFSSHGTWTGTLVIQRSFDNGSTWNDFRTYSSAKDNNVSTDGTEELENVLYRVQMKDYSQSDTGTLKLCRVKLVNPDFQMTGIVKITAVTDSKHASGTVTKKIGEAVATNEWNEGAWSNRRGFPRTISFFEERMVFGGTKYRPQTVWASKTGDWDNFLLGEKADDGLEFSMASDTVNTICWMCQHEALVIGTVDSEWTLAASDSNSALTPTNFKVRRQSVYGSAGIPARMVGDTLLFVQQGKRKVREFVYSYEKNGYVAPDMTILSDHVSESGIKETALQQLPDSILWCVRNDGTVAALTYERDQEVVGWHRHTTQGKFVSVCVIPSPEVNQVWFIVERNNRKFIEVMAPRAENDFFVDCGKTFSGSAVEELAGLEYLEGMTVSILADGAIQENRKVVNGKVYLDYPAENIIVGLAYDSLVSPMPIEIETQNGSSMLRKKSVGSLKLRVYNSVGGQVRCGEDCWQTVISRDVLDDTMDSGVIPKSEVVTLNMLSGSSDEIAIEVKHDLPLPFNLSAISAIYEVNE